MWRDGNRIFMEISDNGIGIPSNQLDNVFKMFYRVSTDRVGTGLGLFIVQEITRKLDGALQLKSEVGIGTSVLIQFEQSAIAPKQTV
jgi:signal transduction histidine kinase